MSPALFQLVVDTSLEVTWGAAGGTTAGELLQVAYEGEPITTARATLADGRELDMLVLADRLELQLPPDTPQGYVTIRVWDDLGNWTESQVEVTGVIVQPPPPPTPVPRTPGAPAGPRARRGRPPRRTIHARSLLDVESRSLISATATAATVLEATSRSHVRARAESATTSAAASSARVRAGLRRESPVEPTSAGATSRRPSRDAEALLLLGVL